jgi:hypothetical protein
MIFECAPPDMAIRLRGGFGWQIFATGEVDARDGELLEQLISENGIPPGSEMYLHSGGGSLVGGIALGRVIRNHNLVTYVGRKGKLEDGFQFHDPGECMSAAAIAYLGGEYRYMSPNSIFGVHRFTLSDDQPRNIDEAQILSATVVAYIESMGVNSELFALASDIPSDDILILPRETLIRLGVINNGQKETAWTLEGIDGVLYLKGARPTVYGMQKYIMVFPAKGDPYLHIIFEGGADAEVFLSMDADRLVIDGELIAACDLRITRFNDNGVINCLYKLTPELLEKIRKAKSVGYMLQFSTEAAVYVGFESMAFGKGVETKLAGLLSVFYRTKDE